MAHAAFPDNVLEDVLASVNAAELGRHHFRRNRQRRRPHPQRHARLAAHTEKVCKPAAGLLWDVFTEVTTTGNLLLSQARREVLERLMDYTRLVETLLAMQHRQRRPPPLRTPHAAGVSALGGPHFTSVGKEDPAVVLARMLEELETAAAAK